jgi:hypothetical protein
MLSRAAIERVLTLRFGHARAAILASERHPFKAGAEAKYPNEQDLIRSWLA